jgi:hypothetical protein
MAAAGRCAAPLAASRTPPTAATCAATASSWWRAARTASCRWARALGSAGLGPGAGARPWSCLPCDALCWALGVCGAGGQRGIAHAGVVSSGQGLGCCRCWTPQYLVPREWGRLQELASQPPARADGRLQRPRLPSSCRPLASCHCASPAPLPPTHPPTWHAHYPPPRRSLTPTAAACSASSRATSAPPTWRASPRTSCTCCRAATT